MAAKAKDPEQDEDVLPEGFQSDDEKMAGENLKRWREEAGFTQPEAAAFADMPLINLQQAEQGRRELKMSGLRRLAEIYGRDFGDVYKPVADHKPPNFSHVPIAKLVFHPRVTPAARAYMGRRFDEVEREVMKFLAKRKPEEDAPTKPRKP